MNAVVTAIVPDTPADRTIISPGDVLRKINGSIVGDVLDYMYLSYDERLLIELRSPDNKVKLVRLSKPEGSDLGLVFETFLMDSQRTCANKCIFCFIDQLPKGMRKTLYYKDDDLRLSFLHGNYITLTNLSVSDIERIIRLRISPVNVSIHTMNPNLRAHMLGTKKAAEVVEILEKLAGERIILNCQIVVCPDINDKDELSHTIEKLMDLGGSINSVSIVPVGLTKHRQGLYDLRQFDANLAKRTIHQVDQYAKICLEKRGSRVFFCADELYVQAGMDFPDSEYYEEYPQLENGVGMMRLFITEFMDALGKTTESDFGKVTKKRFNPDTWNSESDISANDEIGAQNDEIQFSIATGTAAYKYLTNLLMTAIQKHGKIHGKVYAIRNDFFGSSITVSGLVTGGDIIAQLKNRNLGKKLLISRNMLRSGEDIFLDDVTVEQVSQTLGVQVRIVEQNGADLLAAFFEQALGER